MKLEEWCEQNGIPITYFAVVTPALEQLDLTELAAQNNAYHANFNPRPVLGYQKLVDAKLLDNEQKILRLREDDAKILGQVFLQRLEEEKIHAPQA